MTMNAPQPLAVGDQRQAVDDTAAGVASASVRTADDNHQPATPRYDFGEEIARGGMGVVVRGWDKNLGRELAFKIVHEHLKDNPAAVRRFHDEAHILGQLQHPGVVPVHEVGTLPDGRPFFAMKLVKGRTLDDMLKERSSPGENVPRVGRVVFMCKLLVG